MNSRSISVRGIAILGSTGSIGCNSLRVIESLGPERFKVVALAAGRNVKTLADQIERHHPELVSVETEQSAAELRTELNVRGLPAPRLLFAEDGLVEVATHELADCVISATVGAVGFVPTLRALE